jgi:hypothetical protein
METRINRHLVVVIVLLTVTAIAVSLPGGIHVAGKPDVRPALPDTVGSHKGHERLFCQTRSCLASFSAEAVVASNACPTCGGELDSIAFAEKGALPADTTIIRKYYTSPGKPSFFASIVLSASEQKSIHRPQQCLPAQGHSIERNRVIDVPLAGRDEPLQVMLLDLRVASGPRAGSTSAFAYWFVGTDRETPYHLQRLFWMASDRVLRNTTHHWAYVSIGTGRTDGSKDHVEALREFIAELYPLITK